MAAFSSQFWALRHISFILWTSSSWYKRKSLKEPTQGLRLQLNIPKSRIVFSSKCYSDGSLLGDTQERETKSTSWSLASVKLMSAEIEVLFLTIQTVLLLEKNLFTKGKFNVQK